MLRIMSGIVAAAMTLAGPASATLISDWGQDYGDEGTVSYDFQRISAVDTDGAGNIYIAGEFRGQINLGGSTFFANAPNKYDIFLAKYSPTGTHLWSVHGGGDDNDFVYDIDVVSTGAAVVAGETWSPVFTIGGVSDTTNGQSDAFAVLYGSTGAHSWTQIWGGPFVDRAHSAAWRTGTNGIIVSGTYRGTVDFGPGPAHTTAGSADFFITETKVWGTVSDAGAIGGTGDEKWTSVCIDNNNDIIFTGTFENTINFGNGPLVSLGDQDACLLKLPSVGSPATWSQNFGGTASGNACWATSVATDGDNIFMTGTLTGSADLGTGPLTSAGGSDVYIAAYKESGTPVWSVRGGSTESDGANCIDYHDGLLAVAGWVRGTADFSGRPVTSAGDSDALLLVCSAGGDIEYARSGGGPFYDDAAQAAIDSNGICLVGAFKGTADFGSVQLANPSNSSGDGFMVRYEENALVGVEGSIVPDPSGLSLGAPQPNPFRESMIIEYGSAGAAGVRSAEVFDVSGRLVRTLEGQGSAHSGLFRWDGRNDRGAPVSPGVYFVRATDGAHTAQKRVTVVR